MLWKPLSAREEEKEKRQSSGPDQLSASSMKTFVSKTQARNELGMLKTRLTSYSTNEDKNEKQGCSASSSSHSSVVADLATVRMSLLAVLAYATTNSEMDLIRTTLEEVERCCRLEHRVKNAPITNQSSPVLPVQQNNRSSSVVPRFVGAGRSHIDQSRVQIEPRESVAIDARLCVREEEEQHQRSKQTDYILDSTGTKEDQEEELQDSAGPSVIAYANAPNGAMLLESSSSSFACPGQEQKQTELSTLIDVPLETTTLPDERQGAHEERSEAQECTESREGARTGGHFLLFGILLSGITGLLLLLA